ncbi:MAG TPA: DUF4019 domain-containing protein [Candidatus Methylacidiphilales bacterium]|jgi:hypothetical protein|nr:DUF4019 domain-containing protein [Candidatus Methylacidiphilales bacterium]
MQTGYKIGFVRFRLLFSAACLALLAALRVQASAEGEVDQAVAASKAWVAQIDAGKYEDSYSFACTETRAQFPEDRWVSVLKTIRAPWGDMLNRHQLSHVYQPNGVKGLEGECMVITYNTNFKNLANATETVVLKWEDGHWRGAGYFAGVPPDPNAPPPTPAYTTEVQTDEHVKAPPQSPAQ